MRAKTKASFRPRLELLEDRTLLSTYVVATNGSDSNNGVSAPWLTLQHAADLVAPGDTVLVRAGNYKGFDLETGGTASAPISFLADPGVSITTPEAFRNKEGINIEDFSNGNPVNYVTIQGFSINAMPEAGIRAVSNGVINSTGIIINGNSCDSNGTWGIFTSHEDNVLIENNTASRSQTQHGIYVSNACINPTIIGNILWGNASCGLHMNGDISQGGTGIITGALVANNIIHDNGALGGSGINMDGVQDSIIRNNLLYNNHASGISMYQIDAAGPAKNNVIEDNTIVMASNARWDINIQNASTGVVVFNNILLNNNTGHGSIDISTDSLAGFASNYNVITTNNSAVDVYTASTDTDTFISLATWRSSYGQDVNSLTATAAQLFANPAGNDYHLLSTSPAIDKGVASFQGKAAPTLDLDGKPRPSGSAYDIGAYEFQSGGSTNQPPTVATAAHVVSSTPTTAALSVLGADDAGESNLAYTWSATGPAAVTYSANGTNAAKNVTATFGAAGSYTFTVTITDSGGLSTTSSVSITVSQQLTSLSVSPTTATVSNGATQQFTATTKDQFGTAMSAAVAWSVSSTGTAGTISSSGLYKAPVSGTPTDTVKATSGSLSATATVSVVAVKPGVSINAGGSATGGFVADAYFSGGSTGKTSHAISTTGVTNPAPQSVYQSFRYGSSFSYTVPNLTPGASYTVRLDFAETSATAAGQHVFNVGINGTQRLTNFDIFAAAGGRYKAITEQFTAVADSSGKITISFTKVVGQARVNGIEISPA